MADLQQVVQKMMQDNQIREQLRQREEMIDIMTRIMSAVSLLARYVQNLSIGDIRSRVNLEYVSARF
jgi:hypothetical protein